tara:strand:- start:325 stop:519 length:195 start_codon:yes stop_codon:yes gene_type:complete
MVDRDWLYELGRLIPDAMMDDLEDMDAEDVISAVQSLPLGMMEKPKPVKKAKKTAPKKSAKKED